MTLRSRILDTFQTHYDQLHSDNDPEFLDEISEVFDLRHWAIDVSDVDNLEANVLQLKQDLSLKIEEVYDESHLLEGCNIPKLKVKFCKTIDSLFRNEGLLFQSARSHEYLLNQWPDISNIPNLSNCEIPYGYNFIKEFVVQIKTSANKIIEDAVDENISISKIEDSEDQLLIAITEKRTKEEIDNLISFLMKH